MLVAGIDSSTQSTKVELREVDTGTVVAAGRAAHPPADPPRSEQDPRAWWRALVEALSQCGPHVGEVAAVSVAGQQHGLVVLDRAGEPVRPAKLWNDTTSAPQAAELVERLGAVGWAAACGSVPVASFTVTKLAWLAQHEPGAVARIARVALPHDYLTGRLTGEHATDRGDASGTGWYDTAAGRYRADLLDLVGGRSGAEWIEALPEVRAFDAAAGRVTPSASAATGLPEGIPVGAGTGDNMAAALGMGLGPGDVAVSLGTSGTAYAVSATPTHDATGAVAGFCDAAGAFLPLVCTLNATRVTDAVARWLGLDRGQFATAALSSPPGAGGAVMVPYLDGERTPNLPEAAGSLYGLGFDTSPADLARASHEGVVCALLDGVDALAEAGASVGGRLNLVGGGARSPAYRQIAADCWGAPVRVPDAEEAVATGACVQAAQHVGLSLSGATEAWGLGAGDDVEPARGADAAAARAAYRQAAAATAASLAATPAGTAVEATTGGRSGRSGSPT
ncbi:MAG: xylulokinase [Acidimicrobiaceae bacterium]|nr:xylulokinase [Acidimicrobiaceae bacterium]